MITYTYIVKCPECEDEFFDFFEEAKAFALGCLSQKPVITQTEVNRNDFGECTDHCDLGTVWSWEDIMKETDAEPAKSIFTKDDLKDYIPDEDPEFQDDGTIEGFLTEAEQKLATNSKGDYLVRASSGLGYTVFNRSNVAIGGFEEDDDNTAITRFRRGNIKEHVNQENPTIESDQKLDGIDNAVVDCKVAKVISHSEDEKPLNEESAEESCRKPVPEGMSLKDLVEAMEENEDTVECVGCEELFPKDECVHKDDIGWLCGDCEDSVVKCTWCEELFDRSECRMEVDLGWLCDRCEAAIKSRGETLTFREGNYWDFLDESVDEELELADLVKDSINHLTNDLGKDPWAEDFADEVIGDLERNYGSFVPEDFDKYQEWCSAVASEVSRQVNKEN